VPPLGFSFPQHVSSVGAILSLSMAEPHQLDLFNDNPGEPRQLELFAYPPPPPPDGQLELFPTKKYKSLRRNEVVMSAEELAAWKTQICEYQQKVRTTPASEQTALFDLERSHCDPEQIDPLALRLQSMAFYRMPADYPGEACLYFVVDSVAGLILYTGEQALEEYPRLQGLHHELPRFTLSLRTTNCG
jgi:hypothetical protein